MVHEVFSLLVKTTFSASGHAQLCQLHYVIQSDRLNVYLYTAQLFFTFLLQYFIHFRDCLSCSRVQSLCNFVLLMQLNLLILHPFIGPFFPGFWVSLSLFGCWSDSMCKVHIALQELQAVALRLCKWTSGYVVRWLPCI